MMPVEGIANETNGDTVTYNSEVMMLQSQLKDALDRLESEIQNNAALKSTIAQLQLVIQRANMNETSNDPLREVAIRLKQNTQAIQQNVASFENRKAVTDELREVIKTQESEIIRLQGFRNELFEVRKRNLELMGQLQTMKTTSPIPDKKIQQDLLHAEETVRKWKQKATKAYQDSTNGLEKVTNKIFELEMRLKSVISKQSKLELQVAQFARATDKFRKIIKLCLQRIDGVAQCLANTTRNITFKLIAKSKERFLALKDFGDEYKYINGKLGEYHTIISEIANAGSFDFNNQGLPDIYALIQTRCDISQSLMKILGSISDPPSDEISLLHLLHRVNEAQLVQDPKQPNMAILLHVNPL